MHAIRVFTVAFLKLQYELALDASQLALEEENKMAAGAAGRHKSPHWQTTAVSQTEQRSLLST